MYAIIIIINCTSLKRWEETALHQTRSCVVLFRKHCCCWLYDGMMIWCSVHIHLIFDLISNRFSPTPNKQHKTNSRRFLVFFLCDVGCSRHHTTQTHTYIQYPAVHTLIVHSSCIRRKKSLKLQHNTRRGYAMHLFKFRIHNGVGEADIPQTTTNILHRTGFSYRSPP